MADITEIQAGQEPTPVPGGVPGVGEANPAQTGDGFDEFPIVSASPEAKTDDFGEFPIVEPTATEKLATFSRSATGGAVETGLTVGGMVMGAQIGALGGPAAPVTVPLGAAIGAGAGFMAGREAKRQMGTPETEELDPALRPFSVAGEVVGTSVPIAGVPLAAARAGARLPPSVVGNFLNKIVDYSARAPIAFSAAEGAAVAGSAVAGGVSEAFLPGQTGPRIAAEIAGGFFNPTRLAIGAARGTMDAANSVMQSMSSAGRETRAAKLLAEVMEEAGERPEMVARMLDETDIPGVNLTAGQKTGSPGLLALEAKLASESAKFGAEAARRSQDSLRSIESMATALRGTGDPNALRTAAELRARYFRVLLSSRARSAEQEAIDAARKISRDDPGAMSTLGKQAGDAVEQALKDARAAENDLWGAVPKDTIVTVPSILDRYKSIRSELLPEEPIPDVIEGFVSRMNKGNGATTATEVLRFRSRSLALAREAASQGKFNDARILGELAEASLDDLDSAFSTSSGEVADAYTNARTFSRELHDTFTRTFAGTVMGQTRTGAQRIPPELVMRRALGTGKEGADLRLLELENATQFMATRGLDSPDAAKNVGVMLDAQQRLIRIAASQAIDPTTGLVNPARLSRFIRDNAVIINRFPEAKADITAAVKTEQARRAMERVVSGATKAIERQAAFSRIAGIESPSDAIRSAISGSTPAGDLKEIVKLAKRGGAEAIEGMKAAVFDDVVRKATGSTGQISLPKMRAALFDPMRPNGPSVVDVLKADGVFKADDVSRLQTLFSRADEIADALQRGGDALNALERSPDALFDMVLRIAGAKAGASVAGETSGATLVAAGRGSSFARNVFGKLPQTKVRDVLIEAALDPKFAAMLLRKPKTPSEGLKLARQIHAYMIQAGINFIEPADTEQNP